MYCNGAAACAVPGVIKAVGWGYRRCVLPPRFPGLKAAGYPVSSRLPGIQKALKPLDRLSPNDETERVCWWAPLRIDRQKMTRTRIILVAVL